MELTAEEYLIEKFKSEIESFGDGTIEFHTRDIQHLLKCLDNKDRRIKQMERERIEHMKKIDWRAEKQFYDLLELCMTINNLTAEQRLRYIRNNYKDIWSIISSQPEKV